MRPNVFRQVVGIVDTNGSPVFQWANVPNAIPERILGYPVVSDSALSKTSAIKSGSYSMYFGPPAKIVFGDLAGIEFALDPYSLFTTYGTRLRVISRVGVTVPVGAFFAIARGVSLS
jgi:HK97 family phage major capsid protein